MSWFLFIYFSVYGGVHLYLFLRLWPILRERSIWAPIGVGLGLMLMVMGPILVRIFERQDWLLPAKILGWISSLWMAWIFWFLCLALIVDVWNLLAWGAGWVKPAIRGWQVPRLAGWIAIVGLIALATVWGLIEAGMVRTRTLVVESGALPEGADPIKLLFVTDLHLDLVGGRGRLERVLDKIEAIQPDAVLSGGDLIDASAANLTPYAERLAEVEPPLGKWAIFGNHEAYVGEESSLKFHRAAGFEVLRGEGRALNSHVYVGGVDDMHMGRGDGHAYRDEAGAMTGARDGEVKILLKHRSTVEETALGLFDLQLSGHNHGGQIFPFGLLVRMEYPNFLGFYPLAKQSGLYVSPGTGTWGPPLRLFAPPEVTLVRIQRGDGDSGVRIIPPG